MVVELAHTLGMKVVAEGVEDAAQLVQLQEINCDLAQGFYFCGPRSAQELSPLLGLGRLF
jgi:EAL domain-containing protein (putative c-di-GMP-specific phosphodiesterase class I)